LDIDVMLARTNSVADASSPMRSPLTGGEASFVRTIPVSRLIDAWLRTYRIDITDELGGLVEVSAYRCNATGLIFFRPVTIAGSPQLYRQLQAATSYYSELKWEHRMALKDLRGARRMLEIGCGSGSFIGAARKAGIDAAGIEVNPEAVTQAQRQGLPVQLRDLASVAREDAGRFDAVCAFQVLEHVSDPGAFLTDCLRLLKPDGTLIVSVPNSRGFLRYYDEILDLPPHHMSQWSRETFQAIQTHLNVRLVRCLSEPLAENHVDVCVNAYGQWLRSRGALGAMLANRYFARVARALLRGGCRRFVRGHTLYSKLVKTCSPP